MLLTEEQNLLLTTSWLALGQQWPALCTISIEFTAHAVLIHKQQQQAASTS
jgi:hypothetical protein